MGNSGQEVKKVKGETKGNINKLRVENFVKSIVERTIDSRVDSIMGLDILINRLKEFKDLRTKIMPSSGNTFEVCLINLKKDIIEAYKEEFMEKEFQALFSRLAKASEKKPELVLELESNPGDEFI